MSYLEEKSYVAKRERILHYLLLNTSPTGKGRSAKDIAKTIGLSTTGLRHYLNILENEGLITHTEKQGETGRPAMVYSLTETGLNVFPKAYAEFSINLINEIKDRYGESITIEILESISKKKARQLIQRMIINLKHNDSLDTRLKAIVKAFKEEGKFPELIEENSSFFLKNYNCLYYDIVKEESLVCMITETLITEILGRDLSKEKCIREGDECCVFRIMKDDN